MMKTAMIPLLIGVMAMPMTAQGAEPLNGNNYYKLSLRGDCRIEGPTIRRARLSTTELVSALLAQWGSPRALGVDPRRCSIVARIRPWDDLDEASWWLYCPDRSSAFKVRIRESVLRMQRGDKSAEAVSRRGGKGNGSTHRETSFYKFDFDTFTLDHFATLFVLQDLRISNESVQTYRMSGVGHHRTRLSGSDLRCPGQVRVALGGRVSNQAMNDADYAGDIGHDD